MNKGGPIIIIIEDDIDDQQVFSTVFKKLNLPNQLLFFTDGLLALQYLIDIPVEPFIIFSDINMPRLSGMELRRKVHENEDLRCKSIPFLFFTTQAEQSHVVEAYSKSVQGFFVKPSSPEEVYDIMKTIVNYWNRCVSPNYIK